MFFIYISKAGSKEYETSVTHLPIKSFENYYKLNILIAIHNLLTIISAKIKGNSSNKP